MAQSAGYSGKSLGEKLGLKPGMRIGVVAAPRAYADLVGGAPESATVKSTASAKGLKGAYDLIHLFCADRAALQAEAASAVAALAEGGALWVSWPKKSSKLFADLTEDGVRELVLPTGWVDVKVCAVDADWSGLKFLRRRAKS